MPLLAGACGSGAGSPGLGPPGGGGPQGEPVAADSPERDSAGNIQSLRLPAPGTAWVVFGADTVVAEVASRPEQRERGLMERDTVPDGAGMLFLFPRSEERYLWMKDTHVPLDAAFFDESGRIAVIKPLEPLDETLVDSEIATAMVLEVPRGWFAEHGIAVGAVAEVVHGPGLTVR